MLRRNFFKSQGRLIKRVAVCLGVCLLVAQAARSSAQVYTYGWHYSGAAHFTASGNGDENFVFNNPQTSSGTLWLTSDATPSDPVLTINASVDNQSSFAWTGYILDIGMNQIFTINSASVTTPAGWSANIMQPAGPDGSGNYDGTIDYFMTTGGTPVATAPAANSTFSFSYQIAFNGTSGYSMTETATPVPEPSGIDFLLVGGLLFGGWMFRKRGQVRVCATT